MFTEISALQIVKNKTFAQVYFHYVRDLIINI